ncbi:methyl-accepting chemotaxis protein [Sporosarcina beigongshangi]|uniref:methyl-accepting chemotaxis protein n=1 Tax=Sporosarcina beigongshangi TaxID=2782538 RepID=UPI001939801B|nr:methyl-accepting chemotaxis protein [Sporosarcina beigongshangi]
MSKKLQEIINNVELIQMSFTEPTTVNITDTEKFLVQRLASFDTLEIPVGTPIEGFLTQPMEESLKTGKVNSLEFKTDDEKSPPLIITWNPIIENQQVVGLLITATSTEKIDNLRKIASYLTEAVGKMIDTTEELVEVSNVIAAKTHEISSDSAFVMNLIKEANQVIQSIQNTANHSKILGLNASIEAARAGEYGKGFSVVAHEIGRMADQSKVSAVNIIDYLENVTAAINKNNNSIQEIGATAEEHSASVQELKDSFTLIDTTAEELMNSTRVAALNSN